MPSSSVPEPSATARNESGCAVPPPTCPLFQVSSTCTELNGNVDASFRQCMNVWDTSSSVVFASRLLRRNGPTLNFFGLALLVLVLPLSYKTTGRNELRYASSGELLVISVSRRMSCA